MRYAAVCGCGGRKGRRRRRRRGRRGCSGREAKVNGAGGMSHCRNRLSRTARTSAVQVPVAACERARVQQLGASGARASAGGGSGRRAGDVPKPAAAAAAARRRHETARTTHFDERADEACPPAFGAIRHDVDLPRPPALRDSTASHRRAQRAPEQ